MELLIKTVKDYPLCEEQQCNAYRNASLRNDVTNRARRALREAEEEPGPSATNGHAAAAPSSSSSVVFRPWLSFKFKYFQLYNVSGILCHLEAVPAQSFTIHTISWILCHLEAMENV